MTVKKLAVLGGNGMLGSDLVSYFRKKYIVFGITRENYSEFIGSSFDVLINANGNSKRFWANQHPLEDFNLSTVSVYRSLFDFQSGLYIYISSPDVYENHTNPKYTNEDVKINPENLAPYGFHKYISELMVKKYAKQYFILRPSMMLGTTLKKGPLYDIINNNPMFITSDSTLQLITTHAVGKIIESLIGKSSANDTFNVGGEGTFPFTKAREYFDHPVKVTDDAETQQYEMNVSKIKRFYPMLKTSEEYLQEFLHGEKRL